MLLHKVFPQGSVDSLPTPTLHPKSKSKGTKFCINQLGPSLGYFSGNRGRIMESQKGLDWEGPGSFQCSLQSGCPVPSSAPVSTPPTASEALWAFPLSLKHSFTFQLSKSLKNLTTLPLEPEGEPAQLHHGVQTLQLLTKLFLAEPVPRESAQHNARVSTSHRAAGAGPGKTQPHPRGGARWDLPGWHGAQGMCW